jgi:hypothetical protein
VVKTVSTAWINDKELFWQAKAVNPTKRLSINETPGKDGCSIDDMGEGGLDITIDVKAIGNSPSATLQERDEIVAAFMKKGRSVYKPGDIETGWHFSGICADRSSTLKLESDLPSRGYPMSFLFRTDTPFMESDIQHAKSFHIPYSYIIQNIDNYIPGNMIKNYCFDGWSNGTTNTYPDYWVLGAGSAGGYRSADAYLGTYSYAIDGDGTTLSKGQIIQYYPFITGKKYVIGGRIKVTGRTAGYAALSVRGGDGALINEVDVDRDTDGWEWFSFVYDCIETAPGAFVSLVAYGTANVGSTFKFNNICITEYDKYESGDLFTSILNVGTAPTVPDIEVQSGYVHDPNSTTGSSYQRRNDTYYYSTKAITYQSAYTMTLPAVAGKSYKINVAGLSLHSSSSTAGREAWGVINFWQTGGTETQLGEWSTNLTTYTAKTTGPNLVTSDVGKEVKIIFYLKSANSSYAAYIKYLFVTYTEITQTLSVPSLMSMLNMADETTICKLCNKLYPGSTYRVNADGTGYFEYVDIFTDTNYIPIVVVDSSGCQIDSNTYLMNAGGYLVYKFDVKFPIVGAPTLIMYMTGAVQVLIAEDVNGNPGTFYAIDYNPLTSEIDGHYFTYVLNNTSNLPLAGRTILYFKLTTPTNQACTIKSMHLKCDLETIDAERITLNPGANSLKFQGVGDMNCNFSVYYRDKKWGI